MGSSGLAAIDLPPEQMGEVEQIAPQLAVAVGAGLAALD